MTFHLNVSAQLCIFDILDLPVLGILRSIFDRADPGSQEIRIERNNVICFVSGGVDSAFTAAVLSQTKGIGQVHNIYVEALMRKNGINIQCVDNQFTTNTWIKFVKMNIIVMRISVNC